MKNLRVALLLLALLPLPSLSKTPLDTRQSRQVISMDYLMESCTVVGETAGGMVPHFDCESFLYGILDAQLALRGAARSQGGACFPADIAPWQVYEHLVAMDRRGDWSQPAAPFIVDALKERYPCK